MKAFLHDLRSVLILWASIAALSALGGMLMPVQKATDDSNSSGRPVRELEEVDFLMMQEFVGGGAVIVDARGAEDYAEGHISGAVLLPEKTALESYPSLAMELGNADRIVVYCSSVECDDAEKVARFLLGKGHKRVGIYRGGWREWRENQ